jgi:PAS domain S-box-containing protein
MAALDSTWFLNAGSQGSAIYYFFPAITYPMAVMRGRGRWILTLMLAVNVGCLIVSEHLHPGWITPFASPGDRLASLLAGAVGSIFTLALILWVVFESFDDENRKISEYAEALATSERNYREIFNATNDAVFIRDEDGALLDVNDQMCSLFGYDRATALGLSLDDLSLGRSPYSEKEARQHWADVKRGLPQVCRWMSRRRGGELFWSEISLRSCTIAGRRRIVVLARDISERVRAEELLRENEERLRLALEASQQGWFELNVQTGEGKSAEEYPRMLGYEPAEFQVTRDNWLANTHPEDRDLVVREYTACIEDGGSRTIEYRRQTKSGEWKWLRSTGRIVERDAAGRALKMVGTHTDITERKELELRLLHSQRLEGIGTLAAGVAHDLNNILTPMLMVGTVLEGSVTGPENIEYVSLLESGARRGAAIVRQLLAFSRDMTQTRTLLDPAVLMREMQEIMRATFPCTVRVVVEVPEGGLWGVRADSTQLMQVLMNLCINARDAMPDGGTLTLSGENRVAPAGGTSANPWEIGERKVQLSVSDTGHGIPPEIRGRIFDPFFSTKEVGKGTGLGLSTVYGIVTAHGGTVTVDSEPGKGSRFRVLLPTNGRPAAPRRD